MFFKTIISILKNSFIELSWFFFTIYYEETSRLMLPRKSRAKLITLPYLVTSNVFYISVMGSTLILRKSRQKSKITYTHTHFVQDCVSIDSEWFERSKTKLANRFFWRKYKHFFQEVNKKLYLFITLLQVVPGSNINRVNSPLIDIYQ